MFATSSVLRPRAVLVAGLIAATSLSVRQVASAQAQAACKVTGTVGVPFSANLAVACANNSSITVCPLVSGTLPIAPGIGTLSGCVISGTPGEPGVFKGDVFQVGSTDYALEIDIGGSLSNPLAPWNITTVAGSGTITGPAASLSFGHPIGIASDALGNVYFASLDRNEVFKVDQSGNLTTVAGNASASYSGDGGPAIDGSFNFYVGEGNLAVDSSGDLYIGDTYNYVVRRVDASTGTVTTIAGGGSGGTGGPATSAYVNLPQGVAVDRSGNVYIGEPGSFGDIVARVDGKTGIITTAAGILGSFGYSGDGGPATNAQLYGGGFLVLSVDTAGNLYIADTMNNVIRAVNMQPSLITLAGVKILPGDIATIAGNGTAGYTGDTGDGGPAMNAGLNNIEAVTVDGFGNLFIAAGSTVIRAVNMQASVTTIAGVKILPGYIATIAGNGTSGYAGDGGPATNAELDRPVAVTVDELGNIFIADYNNERIRRVDATTGIITTFAGGSGVGDGGPATSADLWLHASGLGLYSAGIALDEQGNLFIADSGNNRVRRVDMSSGVITTVAGNGTQGNTGDEGPAVTAQLDYPSGVAVDGAGNVFIANGAVRRVDGNTGIITTVAGGITTVAGGMSPWDVTIDKSGNLYITNGASIQRIDASTGVITTIAGNGSTGYTGDGGPATKAELFSPNGVAVDSAGNLFIADTDNGAVRRVDANTGIITTVAGGGTGGDGGLATGALLIRPAGVAVSAAGNLFIADLWWGKVFRVDHITGIINTVAGNGTWGFSGDGASALAAELDYPGRVAVNGSDIYIGDIWNNRIRHIQLPAFVILTTGSLTFGSQQLNTTSSAQTVTLTNSGDARLTVTSIAASGDFSESDNCSSGVPVSASCTISVTFKPTESGPRSGAIIITDSAGDSPEVISLTGTATGLLPSTVTVTPSSLSITTALALSVTVAVSGGSGNPTPTGSVILSGGGYTSMATSLTSGSATINIPAVSLAIGSDTLSASYTPDSNSSSIYNTATGTSTAVTVTQAKTTPTINWSTPSPISYDIALSATQLDASSTVAGTFAYTPAAGTVLTAGAQTLSVTLTPTDTTDYSTATASVTLTVNKATPTITWATPAAVTVGTALSATQLNPTASVTGNFSYNPTSGTVMSTTGNYTLTAIFSPNDTTDYNNNFAQVVLVVNPVSKTTPTITWATPASITYGTPLSTTQQNATASVTGTYLYSPSPGTVLPAGSQILNVTFTPSDTTDYNTATATVTLTVNSPSNPVPVMGSMTPAIGNAGGVAFTLTVNGAGFLANSTVYWGTSALSTTYVSATQLTAQVTAADIATAGAYAITVQTPAPGGGTSSALQFEVDTAGSTATGPTFTLTTVSVTAGSPASYPVTLPSTVTTSTVSCLNLPPGASCSYSATSNTVTITTSPTTPAGTYNVTVVFNETVSGAATSWILLPILLLPLVFLRRRMAARGVWIAACLGLVLLAGMAYSTGCGGGGGGGNSGGGSGGGGGGGGTQTHQVTSSAVVTLTVK